MLLSVFTRHSAGCRFSRDRTSVRLELEEALIKGLPPFGSAVAAAESTVHETTTPPAPPASSTETQAAPSHEIRPKPRPRVTVAQAVDAYLADAVSRSVEASTLKKLETIFRKQFLAWTRVQGFEYLDDSISMRS